MRKSLSLFARAPGCLQCAWLASCARGRLFERTRIAWRAACQNLPTLRHLLATPTGTRGSAANGLAVTQARLSVCFVCLLNRFAIPTLLPLTCSKVLQSWKHPWHCALKETQVIAGARQHLDRLCVLWRHVSKVDRTKQARTLEVRCSSKLSRTGRQCGGGRLGSCELTELSRLFKTKT